MFLQEVGGPTLTYGSLQELCLRWADALDGLGVVPGEPVASMVGGAVAYWTWFGAGWLGAVHVPLNPHLRGHLLAAALNLVRARVLVTKHAQLDRVSEVLADLTELRHVVVIDQGEPADAWPAADGATVAVLAAGDLMARTDPRRRAGPEPGGPQAGVFTSGTSGPSKCALISWTHFENSGRWLVPSDLTTADASEGAYYNPWLPVHVLGFAGISLAVERGRRMVVRRGFEVDSFRPDVRAFGCTHAVLLVVTPRLVNRPPDPADSDTPLRHLTVTPLPENYAEIEERFGVRVGALYGQTEAGAIRANAPPEVGRNAGRRIPGLETAIVDPESRLVAQGGVGATEDTFYATLLRVTGFEGDEGLADRWDPARWPRSRERLQAVFGSRTRDEWCEILDGVDLPFAPVLRMDEAARYPHHVARQTFVDVGGVTQPAPAPRFSRTPARTPTPPPLPGADTAEILREREFAPDRIDELLAAGAIACAEAPGG